ncbi:MAG: TolC family protein [Bacteroidales bacterium]|nr:TolC family protein [Bacteroidales bacterium]
MKKLFLTLLISTVCVGVYAADTLRLNLDQAIELALSENPIVKISGMEIQRVDYSKRSAWYNILPSLSASGQYAHFLTPQTMSLAGMTIDLPTAFNATVGVNLSLPLFAPALWHTIHMTRLDMQMAVERASASKITLRNEVTKAFYGVLLAKNSYEILLNGLTLAEDVLNQAKNRYALGLATEFDVISAQVQVQNLLPTIMDVQNGITQAKMFLKVLMGLDIQQPIDVVGSLADYEHIISNRNSERRLSLEGNTDLRQLDIQQQQLQRGLQMQRTQRMPTLAAFGSFTYAGMGNNAGVNFITQQPTPATSDWFSQGLIAGVQLNIPLSGIFTNVPRERQIRVQMNQLAEQRHYMEDMLNVQARVALNNMDRAAMQTEAARQNKDLAQRGYDIALSRYKAGAGIMLEVQNASNQLMQAQLSFNQAIASYLNTKADLEMLLGTN